MHEDEALFRAGTEGGLASQMAPVLIALAAIAAIVVVNTTSWLPEATVSAAAPIPPARSFGVTPALLRDAVSPAPLRGIGLACDEPAQAI